jgi:hypothetical protein
MGSAVRLPQLPQTTGPAGRCSRCSSGRCAAAGSQPVLRWHFLTSGTVGGMTRSHCICRRGQWLPTAQAALQGIGRQCILGHRTGGSSSASVWCVRSATSGCCVTPDASSVRRHAGCRRRSQWQWQRWCQWQSRTAAVGAQLAAGGALRHAAWLCGAAPLAADVSGDLHPGVAAHSSPAGHHSTAGAGTQHS